MFIEPGESPFVGVVLLTRHSQWAETVARARTARCIDPGPRIFPPEPLRRKTEKPYHS
jgi:hypothetical protein